MVWSLLLLLLLNPPLLLPLPREALHRWVKILSLLQVVERCLWCVAFGPFLLFYLLGNG